MYSFTAYDVMVAMLKHLPEDRTSFHADYNAMIDFMTEELKKNFTRSEVEGGLSVIIGSGMLHWSSDMSDRKELNKQQINLVYSKFKKEELLGEDGLKTAKDLSAKFAERFPQ